MPRSRRGTGSDPVKLDVRTLDNEKTGETELADTVFAVEVRKDILHRMVSYQLARRRRGTRKARERGEVTGSTAKIWRQKGTGRARHSSRKAVIFRGGGAVHGPRPRSHAHSLPKKVRRMALRCALSAKVADQQVVVLESLSLPTPQTKVLAEKLRVLDVKRALFVAGGEVDPGFRRAAANLPGVNCLPVQGANVYDILRHETLVLLPEAIRALEERLS